MMGIVDLLEKQKNYLIDVAKQLCEYEAMPTMCISFVAGNRHGRGKAVIWQRELCHENEKILADVLRQAADRLDP